MGSILGEGRFEIKGMLHAYDRWKVGHGKPAFGQPEKLGRKADQISGCTLIPIANLLRTSSESRNGESTYTQFPGEWRGGPGPYRVGEVQVRVR